MTTSTSRTRIHRIAAAAAAITVGVALATQAPVSEASPDARAAGGPPPRTVQVSGQLVPLDTKAGTYTVTGELIGVWTIPPQEAVTYYSSDTRLYQKGIEYFDGCVNLDGNSRCSGSEPSGVWRTDYIYWASFDHGDRIIEGGCVHPITGGTKAFRGARGLLHMVDVYASTPAGSTSIYQGEIVLNAVDEKAITLPATTRLTAPAPAAQRGATAARC